MAGWNQFAKRILIRNRVRHHAASRSTACSGVGSAAAGHAKPPPAPGRAGVTRRARRRTGRIDCAITACVGARHGNAPARAAIAARSAAP